MLNNFSVGVFRYISIRSAHSVFVESVEPDESDNPRQVPIQKAAYKRRCLLGQIEHRRTASFLCSTELLGRRKRAKFCGL